MLDDTPIETDGSTDLHAHGFLDTERWAWSQAQLAAGQAANQLMIIAVHIPIGVVKAGDEKGWWLGDREITEQSFPWWKLFP